MYFIWVLRNIICFTVFLEIPVLMWILAINAVNRRNYYWLQSIWLIWQKVFVIYCKEWNCVTFWFKCNIIMDCLLLQCFIFSIIRWGDEIMLCFVSQLLWIRCWIPMGSWKVQKFDFGFFRRWKVLKLDRGAEKVLNLASVLLKNQVSDQINFAVLFPCIDEYNKSAKMF